MAKSKMPPTDRGYNAYEVVSAYQKAIRRSDVDGAIYWGAELYRTFPNWAWKRLKIIVSEDIGPAAPGLPADYMALWEMSGDKKPAGGERAGGGLMFFVHATILAAIAEKSRVVDWALFAAASGGQPADRDVPDEALDMHTLRGKQMGRGSSHFVEEAGKLIQPDTSEDGKANLELLERRYRRTFIANRAGQADRVDVQLPTVGEAPAEAPKKKDDGETQERLLP